MNDTELFIERLYSDALEKDIKQDFATLPDLLKDKLDTIALASENSKGVLAVTVTSLVYKTLHPDQDVRRHQQSIDGGYSGRTFDSHYITPFLRAKSFPNMAESGWLTRSLEQKVPYDMDYTGAIRPQQLKDAFLGVLDMVENVPVDTESAVQYLLARLAVIRDSRIIELAKPNNLTILAIANVLEKHFSSTYKGSGASRLPVIAFYAAYQALIPELKRYEGMTLLPLESHNSADAQSGRLGDIDIVDRDGKPFEAVEIKHDIPVNRNIVERAKEKILPSSVSRYYILSTIPMHEEEKSHISEIITQAKNFHGCQIVINGIIPSLKYYLRLLSDTALFVENYAQLLATDEGVKFEHRQRWNEIIAAL